MAKLRENKVLGSVYKKRLNALTRIIEKTFAPREVKRIIGLSRRQISEWDKKGILLSKKRGSSGAWSWRKFTGVNLIQLAILSELRKAGLSPIDLREIATWLKMGEEEIINEIKTEIAKGSNMFLNTNLKDKFMFISDSGKTPKSVLQLIYKGFGTNKIILQVNVNNIINDILKSLGEKPIK